ncbi:MAG: DUF4382 domain-containing protein [Gammaproteobacteria bacterium]
MPRLLARFAAVLCAAALLASCGGGSSNSSNNFSVFVADGPIDQASSVVVSLTEIDVSGDQGTFTFPFPESSPVNFYQLQGGLSQFLFQGTLPEGHYTSITLYFDAPPGTLDSNITLIGNGNTLPLVIPAGQPTKITVPVNFIVFQNITASYTLDLDLRRSVLPNPNDPNQYILQPALRAVDNQNYGTITGTVANTLVSSGCAGAVYVYSGQVTPTDVNVNAPAGSVQPISSALVGINNTTGQFAFAVSFLPPGTYTAAFTCQADLDNPTTSDNIKFLSKTTATVQKGQTAFITLN